MSLSRDYESESLSSDDQVETLGQSYDDGGFTEQREFEQAAGVADKPRMGNTTIAMIGLFAVGVAAVAFLSLRSAPQTASAKDQAVEQQVDTFIASAASQSEDQQAAVDENVVDGFYHYSSRQQVPLEELRKNPFVLDHSGSREASRGNEQPDPNSVAAQKRREDLLKQLSKLKLQSVMMGSRGGTAIINNNFVTEGQALEGFTVVKILPDEVHMRSEGLLFQLRLSR